MGAEQENDDIQLFSSWREVPEHYASKTTLRSLGLAPGPLRAHRISEIKQIHHRALQRS